MPSAGLHRASLALLAIISPLSLDAQNVRVQRKMLPEDLFRVRQVGAVAWSPDGLYAALELSTPGRTLDSSMPAKEIAILNVRARALRSLSSPDANYIGYFNPAWSPDARRLAFLSVDSNAIVRRGGAFIAYARGALQTRSEYRAASRAASSRRPLVVQIPSR